MLSTTLSLALAALGLLSTASAQLTPLTPSGVVAGRTATAQWTRDTTGAWTDVTLTLMSGDNFQMVPVTTLATGIDGTSATSYQFTVPEVSPYSAIYFLQFQPANNASAYEWTTRFLISSSDGTPTTQPANSVQPGGQAIPWGVGTLVSAGSNSTVGAASSSAAGVVAVPTTSSAAANVIAATTSASTTGTARLAGAAVSSASVQISAVSSGSIAGPAASAQSGSNTMGGTSGAGRVAAGMMGSALAAVLIGGAALI